MGGFPVSEGENKSRLVSLYPKGEGKGRLFICILRERVW